MPPEDYDVRALALPVSPRPSLERRASSPFWSRPSTFRRTPASSQSHRSGNSSRSTWLSQTAYHASKYSRRAWATYKKLTPLQRIMLILFVILNVVIGILLLVYNETIFGWLAGFAQKWRDVPMGWLILWSLTVLVSFPPLIGYSSLLSLAGFVYGFPTGWPIVASATILGSTLSFIACRHLFHSYVDRLVAKDTRFAALALTIKHDGLKLLIMIRLCPLPYSLSNGALSTIPTVNWFQFMVATACITPKLLVHIFVGAKLGELAEHGGEMDAKTKAISYLSIAVGSIAGIATGWIIYRQTKKRARELATQERAHVRRTSGDRLRSEYADEPGALEAARQLREEEDDISLRDGDDWLDGESLDDDVEEFAYRDESPYRSGSDDKDEDKKKREDLDEDLDDDVR